MRILVLLILACMFYSCRHVKTSDTIDWKGGVIDKPGKYYLTNDSLLIDVYMNKKILGYTIYTSQNDTIIQSKGNISGLHKWMLYWEEKEKIFWVYSSDLGGFIWLKNENERYKQLSLFENKEFMNKVPLIFKDKLPQSYIELLK